MLAAFKNVVSFGGKSGPYVGCKSGMGACEGGDGGERVVEEGEDTEKWNE